MSSSDRPDNALPRGTAAAVVVTVVLAIAAVLIAQQIPHAQRPHFAPTPAITAVSTTP